MFSWIRFFCAVAAGFGVIAWQLSNHALPHNYEKLEAPLQSLASKSEAHYNAVKAYRECTKTEGDVDGKVAMNCLESSDKNVKKDIIKVIMAENRLASGLRDAITGLSGRSSIHQKTSEQLVECLSSSKESSLPSSGKCLSELYDNLDNKYRPTTPVDFDEFLASFSPDEPYQGSVYSDFEHTMAKAIVNAKAAQDKNEKEKM